MGKKKKFHSPLSKKRKEEPKDLYKVYNRETNRSVYLGDGVEQKEAERLAAGLQVDCYIKQVTKGDSSSETAKQDNPTSS